MYTPDGGDSWFLQDDTHIMNAVDFINETHGWAVGWGGVIQRTTKGNSLGSKMSKDGVDISFNTSVLRVPPIVFFIDAFIIGVYPVCLIFRRVWKIRLTRR
jgi:hypothetical protein